MLCNHPNEREKMGKRARELYLNKYDKTIAMKKYEDLFLEILKNDLSK